MSEARDAIFARIRRSLGREAPLAEAERAALDARTAGHTRHVLPALGSDDLVARLSAELEALTARVTRVATLAEVPAVVRAHLAEHALAPRLVAGAQPVLAGIDWPAGLEVEVRAARGEDAVAVTGAFAGVAETGTVATVSGADTPVTHNYLPEDHLLVLRAGDIVAHMEDLWAKLRAERGEAVPRAVSLLTGPSKTADVEQTIQIGAHGPRRFHVIVVG